MRFSADFFPRKIGCCLVVYIRSRPGVEVTWRALHVTHIPVDFRDVLRDDTGRYPSLEHLELPSGYIQIAIENGHRNDVRFPLIDGDFS